MTLDVIIPTHQPEGIHRVAKMQLPRCEGVNFIVSWQNHLNTEIPKALLREDIRIYRFDQSGLSRNRNNAISHSKADLIYLSDDDLIMEPDIFSKILRRFEEYPDTQVATFMMKESFSKIYPKEVTELGFYLPKNYSVGGPQIAFRRELYPDLKFNELFGPKSGIFECGEDEIFHLSARKRGLKCRFFPDIITSHPHEATGVRKIKDRGDIYGMGAVITKSYPKTFFLRIPVKAYRMYKNGRYGFLPGLRDLIIGSIKSINIRI